LKSKQNNEIERSRQSLYKFDVIYETIKKVIDAVKWMFIVYYTYKSIEALAGKITFADLSFDATINQDAAGVPLGYVLLIVIFALLVATLGILYGRRESNLRKDTVERLTSQITALQTMIDGNRTSSMLTTRGETSEKDKR
jgi:hypothetical protein